VNYIEEIRLDILKNFDNNTFVKGDTETFLSNTNNFLLVTTNYWSKDSNWNLTRVELLSESNGEKLFDFFTNDDQFFFSWLKKGNCEYFICAEDLYGGQTIIDLTNKTMASYSPNDDGFIWTDFHLSPDGRTLATIGCFWACPFQIKLYDFNNPMALPLKELNQIDLIGNDEVITGWIDNETLSTKVILREYEKTANGDFTGNVLNETPVERYLKINGTQL
jgi:hypothetical protein